MLTARIVWAARRRRRSLTRCTRTASRRWWRRGCARRSARVRDGDGGDARGSVGRAARRRRPSSPGRRRWWCGSITPRCGFRSSSTRRRALTTAATLQSLLLRADLLVRGSPQEMIVEADAKQLGAHAVVVSDREPLPHGARSPTACPSSRPTRLIAKVTSATPPEVVAEGSVGSSADATAGSVGGGTDASYLLECPEPLRINLDPFHMRVCKEAAASLADAQAAARRRRRGRARPNWLAGRHTPGAVLCGRCGAVGLEWRAARRARAHRRRNVCLMSPPHLLLRE